MQILHVCSEVFPLLKTGGLADVTAALPPALTKLGTQNRVLVPGFPNFMQKLEKKQLIAELPAKFGAGKIDIYLAKMADTGVQIYIIDAPNLYSRDGNPYADENNQAYPDNYLRFALLGWVAAKIAEGLDNSWKPQIVHAHDWHAGLVPAYLKASQIYHGTNTKSVFTVHNLAYQGIFSFSVFNELDLPWQFMKVEGLEFYGNVSFLKAGLFFADKITTVSPTYAKEIQTEEQGCGLEGLLAGRKDDLLGILNGVDPKVWDPKTDKLIACNYGLTTVSKKLECKIALQKMYGLTQQNKHPIFGIVTRLTEQKGLKLVLDEINEIIKNNGQVALLGSGEAELEKEFKALAKKYPKSIGIQIGYDEEQAHRIIAGSDLILVPSRFEPCGLTQLYGLIYGTLPLVHKVGGLADTVTDSSLENIADDSATGFVFDEFTRADYNRAIRRAFALYNRKADWKKVTRNAMRQKFGWDIAAKQVLDIYTQLLTNK
ncbi:glycogen synthase GlgA [Francisella sp. Scap27]|uniref:glycogen synthase GlgA n=1 Tax=Francisella sp. Scap27 TaxID=2589986 RepID=UPI0015C145DA|nr:glycogen synthase GlgA [Francisella sp. Scap27]QLE78404.1 glycogen synthase GlgA [Francisella sp. Scap27]